MNVYDKITRYGWAGLASESGQPAGGDVFYVDSASGNKANTSGSGQGDSWDLPFSTVNYAISRCSNGANNIILVAPGHAETIADTNDDGVSGTTTDEFCVDKSTVSIIGLGENTQRPTFTLNGATDAAIDVRGANCTMANLIFYNTQDGNVAMMDVQATGSGLTLENCKFYESAADAEPIVQLILTANVDDVTIRGCHFSNVSGGDQILTAIDCEGGSDRLRLIDNVFHGDYNEHILDADTAASTDIQVVDNYFQNVDATVGNVISLHASATGFVLNNTIQTVAGSSAAVLTGLCVYKGNTPAIGTQPNHWYVDSGVGVATNSGQSWETALATIDSANNKCTASNGDVIHVAAGHAEDITGGTTFVLDLDVAGVTVMGEGVGDNRPTLTIKSDTTNGMIDLTADDVRITNIIFAVSTTASMKMMITIDGDNVEIDHCTFLGNASQQMLTQITVGGGDNDADHCHIHDCKFINLSGGTGVSAIDVVKDEDYLVIENNYFNGDWDNAVIEFDAGANACADMLIRNNIMIQAQSGITCILQSGVANTGMIVGNTFITDTRSVVCDPAICTMIDNKWSKLGTGMEGIHDVDHNTCGIHLFVDSGATGAGDTAGHGYSWANPTATLNHAMTLCTANQGDIVHIAAGHSETVTTTSTTHPDLDIAGVHVIGHGSGYSKPTFLLDHADAEVIFGANNCTLENVVISGTIDAVTNGIIFDGARTGCSIINCDFIQTGTDELAAAIVTAAGCSNLLIRGCNFRADGSAEVSAINLTDTADFIIIEDCIFHGTYSTCCIVGLTNPQTNVYIRRNLFADLSSGKDTINLQSSSTGVFMENFVVIGASGLATALDMGDLFLVHNYAIDDADGGSAVCAVTDAVLGSVAATADDS